MDIRIHNEVINTILKRRSIRKYTGKKLTEDELQTILQCALWAPSALNQQTTKIAAVTDQKVIEELAEASGRKGFHYGAPCFLLFYGLEDNKWGAENAALAVENASLAAQALGLGSVIIGCVSDYLKSEEGAEQWKEKLDIPAEYQFVLGLLVGQAAEEPELKPRNQENIIWK